MIELIDTGLIYRNPKPFLKSIHAWHPSLTLLDSGELVVSFDLAEAIAASADTFSSTLLCEGSIAEKTQEET